MLARLSNVSPEVTRLEITGSIFVRFMMPISSAASNPDHVTMNIPYAANKNASLRAPQNVSSRVGCASASEEFVMSDELSREYTGRQARKVAQRMLTTPP